MERYIDADALIKKIYPMGIGDGNYTINAKAVKLAIDNAPTADVVPKSEVEEAVKKVVGATDKVICEAKAEVAREFIDAIDSMMELVCVMTGLELTYFGKYAELKKKYTEEQI